MDRTLKLFGALVMNIFIAPLTLSKVAGYVYNTSKGNVQKFTSFHVTLPLLFVGFVTFCVLQCKFEWAWAIALLMYFSFCGCVATIRMKARGKLSISGHPIEDIASSLVLYPSVAVQLTMALENKLDAETGSKTFIFDSPI